MFISLTLLLLFPYFCFKIFCPNNKAGHLQPCEKASPLAGIVSSTPEQLSEALRNIPHLQKCVKGISLNTIDEQCQKLCSISKEKPSVLCTPRDKHEELTTRFTWSSILLEMKERAPDALDVLATIACPNLRSVDQKIPRIGAAYGILMNTRNRDFSLVQRMNNIVLGAGQATKKVLHST